MGNALRRWLLPVLREPLLHFLLIGVAIFAIYGAGSPPAPADAERLIEVTDARAELLAGQFEAAWRRPPTTAELAGLVDDWVREEVYYREALALGLDRDDTVIRRRLRQKMEFLGDAAAGTLAPDEAELNRHFAAHRDRFTPPARITFRQVLLDGADPAAVRARLDAGIDPLALGRATLLPPAMEAAPQAAVDGTFGAGFFAAVSELRPGVWTGPVRSAFGEHLVALEVIDPATPPPIEAVRAAVEADWRRARADALREAHYRSLRDRYRVILPPAAAP
jgi:hypothetical protein